MLRILEDDEGGREGVCVCVGGGGGRTLVIWLDVVVLMLRLD